MSAPTTTGPGSPPPSDDELATEAPEGSWRGVAT